MGVREVWNKKIIIAEKFTSVFKKLSGSKGSWILEQIKLNRLFSSDFEKNVVEYMLIYRL